MSTFSDDIRFDWSSGVMHSVGGDALLAAHPPGSPGREVVIAAGLAALAEIEADIVTVGMRMGVWPMSADGWPLTAGYETHGHIRWTHVREAMRAAVEAL